MGARERLNSASRRRRRRRWSLELQDVVFRLRDSLAEKPVRLVARPTVRAPALLRLRPASPVSKCSALPEGRRGPGGRGTTHRRRCLSSADIRRRRPRVSDAARSFCVARL